MKDRRSSALTLLFLTGPDFDPTIRPSKGGGRDTNWLVYDGAAEGLLFFVFTAPEREFKGYENVFQQMLHSVRLKQ